jgi:hypothetical protein
LSLGALRALPVAAPPPELLSRLRVMASHERERRLATFDLETRLENIGARINLFFQNLMRPVALPLAGGLVSALFLFCMLVPTLSFRLDHRNDVPTALYTEPSLLEMSPFGYGDDEETTLVELTIDERGIVTDWNTRENPRQIQNSVLADLVWYSRYSPASLFGQPTAGKVTVLLRRDRIVVKG